MMRIAIGCALALGLAGCVNYVETKTQFDPNEVSYISSRGSATITGQAFARQNGGGVVTCAGEDVTLVPAGRYAQERMTILYGSSQGGRASVISGDSPKDTPDAYTKMTRSAICDAEGDFEFRNVAAGDYYVTASVVWMVPGSYVPEGARLAEFVRVSPGQKVRVLLN